MTKKKFGCNAVLLGKFQPENFDAQTVDRAGGAGVAEPPCGYNAVRP
jgi:hypothetical protein